MVLGAKLRGSWIGDGKLAFFVTRGTDWPCATALSAGQDVGAHIGAGGECIDAVEAGVGVDGLAQPLSRHIRVQSSPVQLLMSSNHILLGLP